MQHLQPNTTLQGGKYRIERVLGQGGFGNTYVGYNTEFEETVAIKEFFMKGVTQRDDNQTTVSVSNAENKNSFLEQKEKFKKEARRIRQLKNEHIVSVHDLFDENGTAYYVMDFVDGENLTERLKRTGKPMTEQEVREILPQILDALKSVHDAGIWHLDLKPANIMVDKVGNVKLIDFGASKQLNAQKGGATTSTAISYTNGYAPREQMEQNYDKFGPWTDIYALGATLYNLLTNKRPPLPTDIDDDMSEDKHLALPFPVGVSDDMKCGVLWMMKTNRMQRPQSIDAIVEAETVKENESKETTNQQLIPNPTVENDDEATIIDQSQQERGEKIVEPKSIPQPKTAPQIATQTSHTSVPQECNTGEGRDKGIVICMIVVILFIICVLANNGSCNNTTKDVAAVDSIAEIDTEIDTTPADTIGIGLEKNGYFEETYNDGSSYKGHFKDGLYHGQGTFTWANGDKYEGEFKEGARIKGTYTWPEKRKGYMYKYIGEFKNNEFEGRGTAYYVGGETESGIWKDGKYMGSEAEQNLTPLERKVVGKHLLSLQWISWDYFGTCEITKVNNGRYRCVGSQHSKENSDYLKLDGYISIVNENHLRFTGTIITRLHDMNNGNEHVREGTFDFKSTGGRKYWREQEMTGSDGCADYIDIYFQKK